MSDPEKADVPLSPALAEVETDEMVDEEEVAGAEEDNEFVVEDLSPEVLKRVKALKKNQLEIIKIEAQFFKEMHALECKYLPLYKIYFDKRGTITSGAYEPNDEECDLSEIGISDLNQSMDKMAIEDEKTEKVLGVPQFWAQIFRNVELLSDMVQEWDLPILKHLADIQVEMMSEPMGFKLHFHFTPNEYFSNVVLTKTYFMKSDLDLEDPFSFEGPEIIKCTGCSIDWAKGKNITVKTIRKKQKHKQRGSIRTVQKTVEVPSFFNFFNPPQIPEDQEGDMDEDTQVKLTNDFEVGQYIRERIVPRAVLYYTGEALEDEEEDDEYDEEEEEEEADEEEEAAAAAPGRAKKNRAKKDAQGKPQECKQQ